jgi:hypothetical protein
MSREGIDHFIVPLFSFSTSWHTQLLSSFSGEECALLIQPMLMWSCHADPGHGQSV